MWMSERLRVATFLVKGSYGTLGHGHQCRAKDSAVALSFSERALVESSEQDQCGRAVAEASVHSHW